VPARCYHCLFLLPAACWRHDGASRAAACLTEVASNRLMPGSTASGVTGGADRAPRLQLCLPCLCARSPPAGGALSAAASRVLTLSPCHMALAYGRHSGHVFLSSPTLYILQRHCWHIYTHNYLPSPPSPQAPTCTSCTALYGYFTHSLLHLPSCTHTTLLPHTTCTAARHLPHTSPPFATATHTRLLSHLSPRAHLPRRATTRASNTFTPHHLHASTPFCLFTSATTIRATSSFCRLT